MFSLDGLSNIRKVKWKNLKSGSIILSGSNINGMAIPELTDFPVLTDLLIYNLLNRYLFLENHTVLVSDALYNYNPYNLSKDLKTDINSIHTMNKLREEYQTSKKMIIKDLDQEIDTNEPIINSSFIERDYLRKDNYNSFNYVYGLDQELNELPSFFHKIDLNLSIGDLLTKQLFKKFNLPTDKEVMVHFVVDFSKSMDSGGKLDLAINAANNFYNFYTKVLNNSEVKLYAFSDTCHISSFPFEYTKIKRGDTSYSSFMKKVLHHRDRDVHNKIILLTDGLPSDYTEALKIGALIKKNKVDYTQIIFQKKEEQRYEVELPEGYNGKNILDNILQDKTEDMIDHILSDYELDLKIKGLYLEYSKIAEVCGGNQIILKINELISVVTVECYDRYMGFLSFI